MKLCLLLIIQWHDAAVGLTLPVQCIVRLGMMLVVVITQLVCGNCMNAVDLKGTVSREYRQLLCIG